MNKHIFGNSESAEILAEILEKTPDIKSKISARLNEYNKIQKDIMESNLPVKLKKHFLKLILQQYQTKIKRFDGEVKTFSLNMLSQVYRKHLSSL